MGLQLEKFLDVMPVMRNRAYTVASCPLETGN